MKDCIKCGEAFEPRSKYTRICDDCKLKNNKKVGKVLKWKKRKPFYYLRDITEDKN